MVKCTSPDRELLAHFVAEAGEMIERLDAELDRLEHTPDDEAGLNAVFRAFHSVKGAAGFMALEAVVEVCHRAEDELNLARNGQRPRDAALVMQTRAAAEELKQTLAGLESGAADAAGAGAEEGQAADDGQAGNEATACMPAPPVSDVTMRLAAPQGRREDLRIPPARVETMTVAVGGATRVRNRLLALAERIGDAELDRLIASLDSATLDLQAAVTQLRHLPLINVFGRFNRVVKDLAGRLGKEVDVDLRGIEIELDKNLIESLVEPLVHLVRNAIDHGIETPEARIAAGKSAVGRLVLTAAVEDEHVRITVEDDGAGLSADDVRHNAVARRQVDPGALVSMSDRDVLQLVFAPGLSTRAEVSEVSGRGVGLDVVNSEIARLNGRVEFESEPGRGSRVVITLPLRHAVVDGLDARWAELPPREEGGTHQVSGNGVRWTY